MYRASLLYCSYSHSDTMLPAFMWLIHYFTVLSLMFSQGLPVSSRKACPIPTILWRNGPERERLSVVSFISHPQHLRIIIILIIIIPPVIGTIKNSDKSGNNSFISSQVLKTIRKVELILQN